MLMQMHLQQCMYKCYLRSPSLVKLIAKALAIKKDESYTFEYGESDFETQNHTEKGY